MEDLGNLAKYAEALLFGPGKWVLSTPTPDSLLSTWKRPAPYPREFPHPSVRDMSWESRMFQPLQSDPQLRFVATRGPFMKDTRANNTGPLK